MNPLGTQTYEKIKPSIDECIVNNYADYWIANQISNWLYDNDEKKEYENIMKNIREINIFLKKLHKNNLIARMNVLIDMYQYANEDFFYACRLEEVAKKMQQLG